MVIEKELIRCPDEICRVWPGQRHAPDCVMRGHGLHWCPRPMVRVVTREEKD